MPATIRKPTRSLWKKLLLIPAGLVAGLAIGWGGIVAWDASRPRPQRIAVDDYPKVRSMLDDDRTERGLYLFDEQIGYRFKPNYTGIRHQTSDSPHRTNSLGLLGERELDPDPAVRKVLVLGDSVAYGDGIPFESIFVSRMQDIAGPQFQLAAGACPGWNMEQQLRFFEGHLGSKAWNAVVLAVCLNDFVDFGWAASQRSFDWMLLEDVSTLDLIGLKYTRSRLESSTQTRPLSRHDDACMLSWQSDRVAKCLQQHLPPYLQAADRPPLILVLLPTRHQVKALNRGAPAETALAPQSHVARFCAAHDIACLDAAELLIEEQQKLPKASSIFLTGDALHFNDAGHAQLAEVLWPALGKELTALNSNKRSD